MKLYRFETGETDHIAARNEAEARAAFKAIYKDEMDPEVTEVPRTTWAAIVINCEDAGKLTAAEIIGDPDDERDAFLVASTCV